MPKANSFIRLEPFSEISVTGAMAIDAPIQMKGIPSCSCRPSDSLKARTSSSAHPAQMVHAAGAEAHSDTVVQYWVARNLDDSIAGPHKLVAVFSQQRQVCAEGFSSPMPTVPVLPDMPERVYVRSGRWTPGPPPTRYS